MLFSQSRLLLHEGCDQTRFVIGWTSVLQLIAKQLIAKFNVTPPLSPDHLIWFGSVDSQPFIETQSFSNFVKSARVTAGVAACSPLVLSLFLFARINGLPGSEILFPTAVPDPPVRTHLHTANQSYMIWIWMTCVFGIRVRMRVDLLFIAVRKRHARCIYNQIYVQKWRPSTAIQFVQILYYALIDIQRPLSLILNNYAG